MMYECCYKEGFDQYYMANHPTDAKEWHKNNRNCKKQEEQQKQELKYISKFLVWSVPAAKSDPTQTQRVSEARVFTREECVRVLEEKEKEGGGKNKINWNGREKDEKEEITAERMRRKEERQTATMPKHKRRQSRRI